jgi:hypothetical protein
MKVSKMQILQITVPLLKGLQEIRPSAGEKIRDMILPDRTFDGQA